jgi:hypothetical protein
VDVDAIVAAARRIADRVAIELQWDLDGDDDDRTRWVLALHVVVARPGPVHSAYSTIELARLPADELDARRVAHRLAGAVADALGLSLQAPPVEDQGGRGESAWIRAQPVGAPHAYKRAWEVAWWRDDGEAVHARGTDHIVAISGRAANLQLGRVLANRFPVRPLEYSFDGGPRYGGGGAAPARFPDRERVRAIAWTEGGRASGIARGLVARVPDATALELMLAFQDGFGIRLAALAPLAAWRRGVLDDAALDAALPQVQENRDDWDRPRRLREARAAGRSVAAMVRADGRAPSLLRLVMDLGEAFGMSLRDAKEFADRCSDPRNDAELDAMIP